MIEWVLETHAVGQQQFHCHLPGIIFPTPTLEAAVERNLLERSFGNDHQAAAEVADIRRPFARRARRRIMPRIQSGGDRFGEAMDFRVGRGPGCSVSHGVDQAIPTATFAKRRARCLAE